MTNLDGAINLSNWSEMAETTAHPVRHLQDNSSRVLMSIDDLSDGDLEKFYAGILLIMTKD